MSAPELVTVTIDERSVQVPKGTGIVETAAAAGIEIPVFCYEPRLGAAIGACRMCLVEVEGMPPKPQAGCTLTAQDGMVVKTARTSEMARVAQNATLEFILVNHPLDCPVCDKGGECPLQALTFRYGPGNTRMTFDKRTFEKPIPISPAISIDRERCILCYRCTRFSESVSEDNQLVALNRGAQTMIATFEDEPYTGAFTGNVTELCPVGALLPTQPRFEIRPWELQSVPTVCGLCPVGCNIDVNQRLLREADGRIAVALSGSETNEQAYALGKLIRTGVNGHTAMLPEEIGEELDAFRAPLSAIGDAELIVILGDDPVVERAPIVELWVRKARRAGAEIVEIGPAGDIQAAHGRGVAEAWSAVSDEEGSEPEPLGLLIVSGDEAAANPNVRALAERAERVITIAMFHSLAVGWSDLVLPGTSYLERDGTYINLEGRIQRLRRTAIPSPRRPPAAPFSLCGTGRSSPEPPSSASPSSSSSVPRPRSSSPRRTPTA